VIQEVVMTASFDPQVLKLVETEVRNIKHDFRGLVPEDSIEAAATDSLERLKNSRVPQFVPLFVGRFTRERLRQEIRDGLYARRQERVS
jgi:hypothetical protein